MIPRMHFQFVDNRGGIDAVARVKIRSHAAKGKNAGRKIVRPSRHGAVLGPGYQRLAPPRQVLLDKQALMESEARQVPRSIADDLIISAIPADVAYRSRAVIHQTIQFFGEIRYTPQLHHAFTGLDPSKGPQSIWTEMIFADEAYFHIASACAIIPVNSLIPTKPPITNALHHVSHTLRLLERRLSGTDAARDVNIATVVMVAQFERHLDHYAEVRAHLDGLRRMVELRGGIARMIRENPILSHKITRFDLEVAIFLGTPTIFPLDDVVSNRLTLSYLHDHSLNTYPSTPSALRDSLFPSSSSLHSLATETTILAWLLNDSNAGRRPKLNAYFFHEVFLVLGYRLVARRPLSHYNNQHHREQTPLGEKVVHLVLLAFLMPFMHRLDGQISEVPLLRGMLRESLEGYAAVEGADQGVVLWGLLVAGVLVSTLDDGKCAWLVGMVGEAVVRLGLGSWEEVKAVLDGFPWVGPLFDGSGEVLYREAVRTRTSSEDSRKGVAKSN